MEHRGAEKAAEKVAAKAGKTVKWAFVLGLVAAAAIVGYFTIFRTHPAQSVVEKAFGMVEAGDAEGLMSCVDPEGEWGRLWEENTQGARDMLLSLLEDFRLEFSSLRLATRAQGNTAEVALKGGRLTIYDRDDERMPAAWFDLSGSELVLYLEKKGDDWLIGGMNYDILEFIEKDLGFLLP